MYARTAIKHEVFIEHGERGPLVTVDHGEVPFEVTDFTVETDQDGDVSVLLRGLPLKKNGERRADCLSAREIIGAIAPWEGQ